MKRLAAIGFLFCLIFVIRCSDNNSIDNDYEVSYVDMPIYRNIYFKNQGVFSRFSVNMVIYDDDKILVRGRSFRSPGELDMSKYIYYYIDKRIYSGDPTQMQSMGLYGPIDSMKFVYIKNRLLNPKTLGPFTN